MNMLVSHPTLPCKENLHLSITGKCLKACKVYDIHLVNCSQAALALSKQEKASLLYTLETEKRHKMKQREKIDYGGCVV